MDIKHNNVVINALVFGGLTFLVYANVQIGALSNQIAFFILTLILLLYVLVEVVRIRSINPTTWQLEPIVVCSFVTFALGYGVTNLLFFLPLKSIDFLGLVPEVSSEMVKHIFLVLFGVFAMYLGYWSGIAKKYSSPVFIYKFQKFFLPKTNELKAWALPLLVICSSLARLFAINKGIYGVNATLENLTSADSYSQIIDLIGGLNRLAVVLVAMQYYSLDSANSRGKLNWLIGAVVIEVGFGFMSGMKSAIFFPFIIVGICQFRYNKKVPVKWIIFFLIALGVGYAVVEPYRNLRLQESEDLSSVSSIFSVLESSLSFENEKSDDTDSTFLAIASRLNLTYIGSYAIGYADSYTQLPDGSPTFLKDIILAPIYALVPRFIWAKPNINLGLWYNYAVFGSLTTSVAFGPFAYLYFAGGYIAVLIFFYLLGIIQRIYFYVLDPFKRAAGFAALLFLFPIICTIDTSIQGIIVGLVRGLPLVLIVLSFLYKKKS